MKNISFKIYLMLIVGIIIIPNVTMVYFNRQTKQQFREYTQENKDSCYETAKNYNFSARICDEIALNSRDAFTSATDYSPNFIIIILTSILYALTISVFNLKRQIVELKAKIND